MTGTIDEVSGKTFDFVIIGGGTTGLTLANRLSEDSFASVLVLEAGPANLGDPSILSTVAGTHFGKPEYDWAFLTEPQSHANNRSIPWPRGKGLGGSSAINHFGYHLPAKADFDAFETLGNPGWKWDVLKKYQMKSERFIEPEAQDGSIITYDLGYHGTEGPLAVGHPLTFSGLEKPFRDSLANFGINPTREPLSGNTKGTWLTPVTIDPKTHVRSYAANMYYSPVAGRTNLTVLTLARVVKLRGISDASGTLTVTEVEFIHSENTHAVFVGKEAILSAGAIIDPQILELSGIGDKMILNKFGVETKVDLPGVGGNIQEHVFVSAVYEVREDKFDEVTTFDCLRDPIELEKQLRLFSKDGKGVFGMASNTMAMTPMSQLSPESDRIYADLEKTITDGIKAGKYPSLYRDQSLLQLEVLKSGAPNCELVISQAAAPTPGFESVPGKKYASLSSFLNHPFSRGTIHLKSTNPLDHPRIDPHYFEEEFDLRLLVEIFKFNRRLAETEPLKSYIGAELQPGPLCQTNEQIAEYIKDTFKTSYHTIGSCSMLPLAQGGVVDNRLKVYHTTNVRVIDVSIIPLHIGAHLQATAYAIGELGADIVKDMI